MNAVISFLQDVFTGSSANQKPIGLTSLKEPETPKTVEIKHAAKKEINLTELMRRR